MTTPHDVVLPSRDDPVVRLGSEVVGGPLGRRASPARAWWTPLRVLLALTFLTFGVGLVQKDWCRDHAWSAPGVYTHACYSDIPPLYYGRGLADGRRPLHRAAARPAGRVPGADRLAMWLSAKLVPSSDDAAKRTRWYFDINALGARAGRRGRRGRHRPARRAASVGRRDVRRRADAGPRRDDQLGPVRRRAAHPGHAGVGPRETGGRRRADRARRGDQVLPAVPARSVAGAVPAGRADARVLDRARRRGRAAWAVGQPARSCWPTSTGGRGSTGSRRSAASASARSGSCSASRATRCRTARSTWWPVGCSRWPARAIAVLALVADRRPRLPQLVFLVVAAFLLTNKVYSPQYVLWLLPLVVLARPRWRDFLIWQAGEVLHYVGTWMLLAGYPPGRPERALSDDGYGLTVLAHIGGDAVAVRDGGARHPAARARPGARPAPRRHGRRRPGRRCPRRCPRRRPPRPRLTARPARPPRSPPSTTYGRRAATLRGAVRLRRCRYASQGDAAAACPAVRGRSLGPVDDAAPARSRAAIVVAMSRMPFLHPSLLAAGRHAARCLHGCPGSTARRSHVRTTCSRLRGVEHLVAVRRGVYALRVAYERRRPAGQARDAGGCPRPRPVRTGDPESRVGRDGARARTPGAGPVVAACHAAGCRELASGGRRRPSRAPSCPTTTSYAGKGCST